MSSNTTVAEPVQLVSRDYIEVIWVLILALIAIIGNTGLLLAMKQEDLFKNGGYLTLAHFSICDLINAFVAMFYYPIAVLSKAHNPMVTPIIMFAEASRKVFLTYMSFSRFWVIKFPISGKIYFDTLHTKRWLVGVWVTCILVTFPMAYPSMGIVFNTKINQWAGNKAGPTHFPLYSLACNIVPTALMVFLYPSCIYQLVKQKNGVGTSGNQDQNVVSKKERHIFYLFCANALVFILYWLPFYISMLSGAPYIPGLMETVRGIQSAYNPFLYFFLNPTIRKAIKSLYSKEVTQVPAPVAAVRQGLVRKEAGAGTTKGGVTAKPWMRSQSNQFSLTIEQL